MLEEDFIREHRTRRVEEVALLLAGRKELDAGRVLRRIEGWQRLRQKVPSWAACEDLDYPRRLALEQCSGGLRPATRPLWPEGCCPPAARWPT